MVREYAIAAVDPHRVAAEPRAVDGHETARGEHRQRSAVGRQKLSDNPGPQAEESSPLFTSGELAAEEGKSTR